MRALLVATVAVIIGTLAAGVTEGHKLPPFVDMRNRDVVQTIDDAKNMMGPIREEALFARRVGGHDDCGKCMSTAATAEEIIATDPTLAEQLVDGLVCDGLKGNLTQDLCRDLVKAVMPKLSHLAQEGIAGDFNFSAIVCGDLVHKCVFPCCNTPTTPEQVHLSFPSSYDAVGELTSMAVTWTTLEATDVSLVQWWPTDTGSSATAENAVGMNRTYHHGGWLGMLHTSIMTGLSPNTSYTYRVGASYEGPWSPEYTFRTLPLNVGTAERPLRVLFIADMGCDSNARPTIAAITKEVLAGNVDFIAHPGDIGYDDGDVAIWDKYMRDIEPFAARVAYMTAPGNHELLWNFSAYKHRFAMPQPDGDTKTNMNPQATQETAMYYKLNIGTRASLFFLDSESVIDTAEMTPWQSAWFAANAAESRQQRSLIVSMTHRPLYCSSGPANCVDQASIIRAGIERTLNDQRVALHVTGHLHEYERTLPINMNGQGQTFASNASYTNTSAPVYVVNGAAGNPAGQNSFKAIQPWSVSHSLDVGFSRWDIVVDTAEGAAQLSQTFFASATGAVVDTFTMTQEGL